jgi:hypothetical protein
MWFCSVQCSLGPVHENTVCTGSRESYPGVIYTPGNRSDECEKSPETPFPTMSCVYSLSKNNLSPSDAGTYYCAMATCGEILLGNRTKLDMATDTKCNESGRISWIKVYRCRILIWASFLKQEKNPSATWTLDIINRRFCRGWYIFWLGQIKSAISKWK